MKTCALGISLIFTIMAMTATWLTLSESSPLSEYFLYHGTIPNLIGQVLIVPYLVLMIFRPEPPLEAILMYGLEAIQWLVIGYVLGWLLCKLVSRLRA